MSVTTAGSATSTAVDYDTAVSKASTLSGTQFLELMVKQLQSQDPLSPMDTSDMIAQLSQLSSMESMNGMTSSMDSMILSQSLLGGTCMIGNTVTGTDDSGNAVTGKVQSVSVDDSVVYLNVGDSSSSTTAVQMTKATKVAAS